MRIDINSDVGERPEALRDGSEELLLRHLSSANIACGGHAGDEETMAATVQHCLRHGVAVGAHPGYPDRDTFGRREMNISPDEIEASVFDQVKRLADIAFEEGASLNHVKPHGALYNSAARKPEIAAAIGRAVQRVNPRLMMVGLAGSRMLESWCDAGLTSAAEAFADRRYESDGSLRSRTLEDALITSPAEAAEQVLRIVRDGVVISVDGVPMRIAARTVCVHSDTAGALEILLAVREALGRAGVSVARLQPQAE